MILNRDTLGAALKAILIEKYGRICHAAEMLDVDYDWLRATYSRKHKFSLESIVSPQRMLSRLGYEIHFTIVKKEMQNGRSSKTNHERSAHVHP